MKFAIFYKKKLALLLLSLAPVFVQAALTDLANNPITGRADVSLAPNIMFILDESLSMTGEFMPDWAGGFNNSNLLQNFGPDSSQKENSSFNGIAYNPATTYFPPAFFTNTGFTDTTTYPSQTKENTSNWTKVFVDPFTDKADTVDLTQQNLVYFTTIPGEYCNSKAMLDCQVRSAPEQKPEVDDGNKYYTIPAYLRWCNSSANATKKTPDQGACQAVEIDNINTAAKFGFPRMPWPVMSTLTIPNAGGSISSITVESQQILSAQTGVQSSGADLAAVLQDSINKCSFETTGTCGVVGYRAIASRSYTGVYIVSIYAPKQFTADVTPAVTGTSVSQTKFASINTNYVGFGGSQMVNEVTGINLPTVIFAGVQQYPKNVGRTDCKTNANYCTYEEEMTNYANWYAYYRTRMQMMKTGTSLAFASTTDSFRIGFMTINNQTGTNSMGDGFLNIKDFNSQQKYDWYVKLFSTKPKGDTPLRQALAQAGRIYAGKLKGVYGSGSNSIEILDPVQHSCQVNVTILSTDGYWNQGTGSQLDGSTAVGDQDGPEILPEVLRPQLDGGQPTFTITATQNIKNLVPQYRPQARVTTTTADHYQLQVSTKSVTQKRETPLQARTWNLQRTVWPLQKKEASLQQQTKKLLKSTWGEYQLTSKWDVTTYQVKQTVTNYKIDQITKTLQKTTVPLKQNINTVKMVTYKLQYFPYTLTQTNYQLQVSHSQQAQQSLDRGVTWTDVVRCEQPKYGSTVLCRYSSTPATGLNNVPTGGSCIPVSVSGYTWDSTNPGKGTTVNAGQDTQSEVFLTQTSCSYNTTQKTAQTSCTPTVSSFSTTVGSAGTSVVTATTCAYNAGSWTDVGSNGTCVSGSASTGLNTEWKAYQSCQYRTVSTSTLSSGSCTQVNKSSSSPYTIVDAVDCSYSGTATGTTNMSSCSASGSKQTSTANGAVYSPYIECAYDDTNAKVENVSSGNTCATRERDTSGTFLPEVKCAYKSATATVSLSSCTPSRQPASCADTGNPLSCTQIVECTNPTQSTTGPTNITTSCTPSSSVDQLITCSTSYVSGPTEMSSCPANAGGKEYTCVQKAGDQVCGAPGLPNCVWAWSIWTETDTCTPTHLDGGANPADGATATKCKYDTNFICDSGTNCWSNVASCTPNTSSTITVGTTLKPLVSCQYSAYSAATGAGASCTSDGTVPSKNSLAQFTKPVWTSCGYWSANPVESPASSCQVQNSGKQNTTGAQGVNLQGNVELCAYVTATDWTTVTSSCTPQPRPVIGSSSITQSTATDCRYGTPGNWGNVPVGQTCTKSASACTLPSADTCTGAACQTYPTCNVAPFVECEVTGWSDWTNVTDANAQAPGVSCKADGDNSTTGTVKCQYAKVGTKYYVGTEAKDCANINQPRITNFSTGSVPLLAVEGCKKNWILPGSDAWVDVEVDLRDSGVAAITAGTIGKYNNATYTFQAQYLPGYQVNGVNPNSSGIKDAAGYNLETRAGDASTLAVQKVPVESCDGVASDDDHTYLHNKVSCSSVQISKNEGQIACPSEAAMKPSASNNWTATTCVEVAGSPTPDTLADVAQYYYMTDLRTEALGNCTGPSGNDLCINNMQTTASDPAKWQHMVTYTLGLGASGFMQYDPNYRTADSGDFYAVAKGTKSNLAEGICSWQLDNTTCNWPKPVSASQTNIDDLWHAAVNGRGVYYSAGEPTSLSLGLQDALKNIGQKEGSSSGVTLSSPILTEGNNFVFYGGYTDGAWTGELIAREIDPVTGNVLQDYCLFSDSSSPGTPEQKVTCPTGSTTELPAGMRKVVVDPVWTAQSKLDAKTPSTRKIYTFDVGAKARKPFEWGSLTTDEQGYFSQAHISTLPQMCTGADISCLSDAQRADAAGENLVNFLRGDRTNEDSDKIGLYRKREHLLGDIVNASPAYVKGSDFLYTDKGYWKFKMDTQNRRPMVYAAANDGMLHAFYAADDVPNGIVGGTEAWAYVPRLVMPNLFNLASKNYKENHRFFVDGSPVVGDICVENCSANNEIPAIWRTVLVGGLNHGGNGYYALDITDPENPQALWEFTDVNMGYTFGNPVITKLKPEGKWVVMFASGYNNVLPSVQDSTQSGDGKGHLYIVDALSGLPFEDRLITTGVGSLTEPSGLSRINVWVDYPLYDNTAERVYGGDLLGNLWRFDINGHNAANSYYAQLLAVLKNTDGDLQPITAKPELGKIDSKPIVFVGTGKLLGPTDMLSASWQSFYGIYDPVFEIETTATSAPNPIYNNPRSLINDFVQQQFMSELCSATVVANGTCQQVGANAMLTTKEVNFSLGKKGWYVDFMVKAERADTDPYLTRGTLVVNTNVPTEATECAPGGYNNRYYINAATGGGFGEGEWGDVGGYRSEGLVANTTVGIVGDRVIDYNQIDGRKDIDEGEPPFEPTPPSIRRVSWKQLLTDN